MEEKRYMNYSLATYHTKDGKNIIIFPIYTMK